MLAMTIASRLPHPSILQIVIGERKVRVNQVIHLRVNSLMGSLDATLNRIDSRRASFRRQSARLPHLSMPPILLQRIVLCSLRPGQYGPRLHSGSLYLESRVHVGNRNDYARSDPRSDSANSGRGRPVSFFIGTLNNQYSIDPKFKAGRIVKVGCKHLTGIVAGRCRISSN